MKGKVTQDEEKVEVCGIGMGIDPHSSSGSSTGYSICAGTGGDTEYNRDTDHAGSVGRRRAAAAQSQSSGSSQNYSNSNSGGSSQSTYTEPAAPAQDNSGSSDDSNQGCVDDGLTY